MNSVVYLLQLLLGVLGGNSCHLAHHALDSGRQVVLIVVDVELLYGVEVVQQPLEVIRYGEGGQQGSRKQKLSYCGTNNTSCSLRINMYSWYNSMILG